MKHPNIHVNARNNDNDTALTIASKNGFETIVKLLLRHPKINVNASIQRK